MRQPSGSAGADTPLRRAGLAVRIGVAAAMAVVCAVGGAASARLARHARDETGQSAQDQEPIILVGAGDIANCEVTGGSGAVATARLLDQIPGTVFTVGDHAYPAGGAKQFEECYGPRWGRHKARTRPAPGNHDYLTDNGRAYYDYFGDNAGPERRGYYSYTLGTWHILSLNSFIAADRHSPQLEWLRKDLEDNHSSCILAYWHIPVFSSGPHGSEVQTSRHMQDVWRVLYEHHTAVVISGHDHDYERFAPQDADGKADPKGIREFVIGTGGGGLYEFRRIRPNSEARSNRSYGLLKLTLSGASYTWEFVTAAGEPFQDSGTASCTP